MNGLLNDLLLSLLMVTQSPGFFLYLGSVISLGMVVGYKLNHGAVGFRKSLVVLLPFTFVLLLTMLSRLYFLSFIQTIGPTAYNAIITIFVDLFGYVFGLWCGHYITKTAVKQVYTEHDIKISDQNVKL